MGAPKLSTRSIYAVLAVVSLPLLTTGKAIWARLVSSGKKQPIALVSGSLGVQNAESRSLLDTLHALVLGQRKVSVLSEVPMKSWPVR